MTTLDLLKAQIKNAREVFDGTANDIQDEHLHINPGGKALTLAATYAHLIFSEDAIVHGILQGKPSLSDTTWKDKTGASVPMPPMDANWQTAHEEWAKTVHVDLEQMKEYAKAVYAETDAYVNSLTESDLDREIDMGSWGKQTVAYLLYAYIIAHTNNLAGELSALKGVRGAKGYPF
jgi:uncharacterized damage-inducible protein DinB